MPGGLLTDLYELNMAASYLYLGMSGPATFSLFARRLPAQRGFLIAAGLEDCLAFLETFAFTEDDLSWLADPHGFTGDDLAAFRELRFTGDVWACRKAVLCSPTSPFLEVTAPAAEAQLVETALLNHATFQTSVATKAARCVLAAGGAQVVDLAFRRTRGIEAGLAVARAAAIAGFSATSNTEAARRYGLTAAGTMAHSFIEAFGTEQAAFTAFARQFLGGVTFLADTDDTEPGIRAAIDVITRLRLPDPVGVRLDPGDLADDAIAELTGAGAPVDEPPPPGHQELLYPVMLGGARTGPQESLAAARERCAANLAGLP